ncbi:hypothetical protein EOD41_06825 [Mucilaginibacter limnophilus]|uniref:Uncharacterized protein n=1 Tax=Mucilaginibacter limnophilus TaxID=1932778 RepID=A0A3S2UM46_9SPHI|nr:hypothetical protein [Mucilaginibacter limnophilus]RVU01668.1 hypothetical protein EOD41_06825 [Mucilaginibacter limnophilus]
MNIDPEKDKIVKKEDTELQTDQPLSEKDEVKQAEQRTAQSTENTDSSVAADLKNREHDDE